MPHFRIDRLGIFSVLAIAGSAIGLSACSGSSERNTGTGGTGATTNGTAGDTSGNVGGTNGGDPAGGAGGGPAPVTGTGSCTKPAMVPNGGMLKDFENDDGTASDNGQGPAVGTWHEDDLTEGDHTMRVGIPGPGAKPPDGITEISGGAPDSNFGMLINWTDLKPQAEYPETEYPAGVGVVWIQCLYVEGYDAITFWAKGNTDSILAEVRVPSRAPAEFLGECEGDAGDCGPQPTLARPLTSEWSKITVPFADLENNEPLLDRHMLYGLVIYAKGPEDGGELKYWIDDIAVE